MEPATSYEEALARLTAFLEAHDHPAMFEVSPDTTPLWMINGVTIFLGDLRQLARYQRRDPMTDSRRAERERE